MTETSMDQSIFSILANSDGGGIFLLFIIGFIALIGGIFFISHKQAKKRTESLRTIAASLDMSFRDEKCDPTELGLAHMKLFARGRSRKAYNIMKDLFADVDCLFFDYRYTTGSGKNSSTHVQTVVAFKVPNAQIPQFVCKPEHFFHKFADMFGFEDINFEQYPNFSKSYRLNGDDDERIRKIFTPEVIQILESETTQPWSVDGAGDWLVIYRAGRKVDPEKCSQFLLDSTTLLNAMTLT
jgi:hypothetical protein